MSERATDNLFVISGLGQARNAVRIADSLEDRHAAALVVVSGSRVHLGRRLESYLVAYGLDVRVILLPELPTAPRPFALRSIVRIYRDLASELAVGRLWIANVNAHYGVLAQLFSEQGARICYFEEGLGSYRRADDPVYRRFETVSWSGVLGELWTAVRGSFNRSSLRSARRFARTVISAARISASVCSVGLGSTAWYRRALALVAGPQTERFFHPWTDFVEASVAFPAVLDRRLVATRRVERLPLAPLCREVDDAVAVLDAAGISPGATLYVSQPYGDRGSSFYLAVARSLRDAGVDNVVVRTHPREREYNLAHMASAFGQVGLAATWLTEPDGVTAESMLATGRFSTCVGLASSTLLYGPQIAPEVEFVNLGARTLSMLRSVGRGAEELETLRSDLDLFDTVSAAVGVGP